ncbi:MAG TPA: hypothetical protein DD713_07655 [Nitrospiraceae bacterium]|nr:hypothetical protein [Nitrospiraceae bacterium]
MKWSVLTSWALIIAMALALGSDIAAAQTIKKDESLRMGEKRPTLDPNIFSDNAKIKKAYQVAKDIPWVLDSIYCYCYCKESPAFKHKSLLSCYVDNHAAM